MIYFEVRNKSEEIIVSNIQKCKYLELFCDKKNYSINDNGNTVRSGFCNFENVSVWLIVENDQDLFKSTKLFKRTMRIYGEMAESYLNFYLGKIRAHSHTLRSIQGKMKQKIESLAKKKDFRGQNYAESKRKIIEKIISNADKTADVFCYLNKRISEIDAHIEGFDVLYMGDEGVEVKKEFHDFKKVLQNIVAPSLAEFKGKNIEVSFHIKDDYAKENKVLLDYKLMNLAFVNFFDNAVKYSKPDSEIDIYFKNNGKSFFLEIVMISLRIEHDELEKIFDEGYVGKYATSEAGDGIGMHVIRKSLGLMNIGVVIEPNYGKSENYNGKQYIENKFIFSEK